MPNLPALVPDFSDALASAEAYARAESSEATRRAYAGDFSAFVAWCARVQAAALPASPATVAAYLAELADRGLKASTIERKVAAVKYAHRLGGHASPTDDYAVKAVSRGIRRKIGIAKTGKSPATAPLVAKMVKKLPATLAGKRDRAVLLLGFAAALRRSELIGLCVSNVESTTDGAFLRIGKSKTDQEGVGYTIAIPRGGKLGVLEALDDWLAASAIESGPLFRQITRHGAIGARALTGQSVALIVKRVAKAAKLDPALFSGHSLRSGFVTSALEAGSDLFKIMDVTRHREVATLRVYDRRAKAFKDHAGKKFL